MQFLENENICISDTLVEKYRQDDFNFIFIEDVEHSTRDNMIFLVYPHRYSFFGLYFYFEKPICKISLGNGTHMPIEVSDIDDVETRVWHKTIRSSLVKRKYRSNILFVYLSERHPYQYTENERERMTKHICKHMKNNIDHPDVNIYNDYTFTLPIRYMDSFSDGTDDFDLFTYAMKLCSIEYDDAMAHDKIRFSIEFVDGTNTCEVTALHVLERAFVILKSEELFTAGVTKAGPKSDDDADIPITVSGNIKVYPYYTFNIDISHTNEFTEIENNTANPANIFIYAMSLCGVNFDGKLWHDDIKFELNFNNNPNKLCSFTKHYVIDDIATMFKHDTDVVLSANNSDMEDESPVYNNIPDARLIRFVYPKNNDPFDNIQYFGITELVPSQLAGGYYQYGPFVKFDSSTGYIEKADKREVGLDNRIPIFISMSLHEKHCGDNIIMCREGHIELTTIFMNDFNPLDVVKKLPIPSDELLMHIIENLI